MGKSRVYVVDDERIVRVTLADELRESGYEVKEFSDPRAALTMLRESPADIVVSDLKMPGMDGVAFLKEVKTLYPETPVVMMTAYATVGSAVEAMKLGASDYLIKPFQPSEMVLVIERMLEIREIREENRLLKRQLRLQYDFGSFIGAEKFKSSLEADLRLLLENKTTVLISGETGTGKELLANMIHHNSSRRSRPLIKVSCAILSKEIFESELFGHVKGAFTGAERDKAGRFELADGGTLYLDDIDDMPLDLQVKLLRVLEEGEIELVGSSVTKKIDVRIIASTKADLMSKVQEGTFREDLFYRLNVFPLLIPPLRKRPEDIPVLCAHFYRIFTGLERVLIHPEVLNILSGYSFPGNVRELRNLIERMVLKARGEEITSGFIPEEITFNRYEKPISWQEGVSLPQLLDQVETEAINQALELARGNRTRAAELLGVPLSTLRTKMEKHNLI